MLSRSLAALDRRRNDPESNEKGFTLIELLVVVIIIGILAAIAIPVYMGVQNNAKDAGVQSDLTNAKTAVISIQTSTGVLPVTTPTLASAALTAAGLTKSDHTSALKLKTTGTVFCITGISSTGAKFFVTDSAGVKKVSTTAPVVALPATCTP